MTDAAYPEKQVRISGVGQSKVGRPSKRTALQLTLDACLAALGDAGLPLEELDGLTTYPGPTGDSSGFSPIGATEVMFSLGIQPKWVGASTEGHGHMSALFSAIQAIASGMCRHVLIFRTVGEATARSRAREASLMASNPTRAIRASRSNSWTAPFRAYSPSNIWALYAQAYCARYGVSEEQLGAVAVNGRRWAILNPNAIYRDPISIEDYMASRIISTPLRLYDCDVHIDGSTAILLSHKDAAIGTNRAPLVIEAIGMGLSGLGIGLHEGDFTSLPAAARAGKMMWERTDMKPADIDMAQLYDGFSILSLMWAEALQLCRPGEAPALFQERASMPVNTSGGQLSAGRFHGYGHIYEACKQLWGAAGKQQVPRHNSCVVTNGGYGYGSILLRQD